MNTDISPWKSKIAELENEISVLKQHQIEVDKAKELYLKIFEEFPALIWRSRLDKLCDYFNKTWLDFTGRTMEQEFGTGWAEGVHPDDFDFCLQTYMDAFDKREAFLMEYRMKNKLGEYRWIRDFGRPFYDLVNTFMGYIGSCYDITSIKDNELKLTELNATKDKLFSIIAHDLRGPFATISGLSDLLAEAAKGKEYARMEEFSAIIQKSSARTMDLITNLMEWAQSQTGRLEVHREPFDIAFLAEKVISQLSSTAEQKSIALINTVPSGLLLFADQNMISTVLRNLISNALKFTQPDGMVTISAEKSSNEMILSVKDNGIGISADRLGKIFQIDASPSTPGTRNEKGSGLGLILCKDFIEKHQGRIWGESETGTGSTFYFSIPVA